MKQREANSLFFLNAAQHEHECSLSTQREALVKQADVELQTLVLQEQVLLERQYKDYVLNKLAQQIYRAHNVPVELSVEKALQELTSSNLFMSYAPSTLDTYLEQRNQRIVDDCKRLVDQYVQRKLSTAQTVLLQQHKGQATALKSTGTNQLAVLFLTPLNLICCVAYLQHRPLQALPIATPSRIVWINACKNSWLKRKNGFKDGISRHKAPMPLKVFVLSNTNCGKRPI